MFSKFKILIPLLIFTVFACREKIIEPGNNFVLPPPTPQNVKIVSAVDGVIVIEWQALSGIGIGKYFIYRGINNPSNLKFLDSTYDNYYSDDSLYYDSTYYYAIASVNRAGEQSKLSKTVSAKPVNVYAPYPPFGLSINARNWNDTLTVNLAWNAPLESDINHYEIYRGATEEFGVSSKTFVGATPNVFFVDSKNLKLLTDYYYKVVSVDNGGLKSKPTGAIRDVILDRPIILSPKQDAVVPQYFNFRFVTCSREADYKIIIQSNKLFGVVAELAVGTKAANDTVSVGYDAYYLDGNRTYYWRVISYSGFSAQANSFSKLGTFKISNF